MKILRGNWHFATWLMLLAVAGSCKKQTEQLPLPALADYTALQTGKVLVYRLDSTNIDQSATQLVVTSYLVKDSIASTFTDNAGRLSYTIYRFITDTLSKGPWQPLLTYYVTPGKNTVETVDDKNLRYISLTEPVTDGFSWNGNSYIDTRSATSEYQFMDGWNYTYQNINQPYTTLKGDIDSTITVLQVDDTSPPGEFDPGTYQQRNYSLEVYGKGTGLVYKTFLHWTWQPTPPPAQYQNDSYGIRLNLMDVR
ncbi:MAG TPA: hypothetical protein VHB48_13165 [Chitinophagaceae bacterium]|jgi:hypothetical protein|nr:hypothetical protein [Chitinophagaceae bacterium]